MIPKSTRATLTMLVMLLFTLPAFTQSVYTSKVAQKQDEVTTEGLSFHSPWMYGSKFTANVNGEQGLSGNILFSQKVIYPLYEDAKFMVPAVAIANLAGGGDPLSGDSGYNLGLYPYYIITTTDRLDFLIHGVAAYKTLSVDSLGINIDQLRFALGFEGAFYGGDRTTSLPVTLSVTPVFQVYAGDAADHFDNLSLIEITIVVPMAESLGVLAELQAPFSSDQFKTAFRVGLMVNLRTKA